MEVIEAPTMAVRLARRTQILRVQSEIIQGPNVLQADCSPVRHFYAPGQYAREITMPANIKVVGRIHKHKHINMISRGHVIVFTEFEGVQEYVAPCTFVSEAMTKRVVVTLEETVWTTFHVTDKTTLEEIMEDISLTDYPEDY